MMAALFLFIALAMRRAKTDSATGGLTLKYSLLIPILGLGSAILWPVVLVVVGHDASESAPTIERFAPLLVLALSLMGLYLAVEGFGSRITVCDDGIHSRSWWRLERHRFIPWKNIVEVRYSMLAMWFVIVSRERKTIRAHVWLTGIKDLAMTLRARLPFEAWSRAENGFRIVLSERTRL